ncbi:MAG TPA: NAD-dependent epimerase/dehydratase family protein [Solirubrobacteraceae bacterium]|jgi:UDP-glucose 4-epimerase|nr:NAD-dependent epimerase/dehydratase family protein [Solirubrobacteraceae bacterium]
MSAGDIPGRSRRILLTGLSTYWGGRLAQELEKDLAYEVIVGVDSKDPTRELERTEFVRIGTQHSLIRRIVQAAEIDTVIDARLVVDSAFTSPRSAHENNVIGTMNIVTACAGVDSPVRKFVFKSSAHYYGCERDDPAYFTEDMERPHAPATPAERDILEAEGSVRDFAERNRDKTVTILRFANGLGPELKTSHSQLLSLPVVPTILGFDPRYQFIHEDDIVGCLEHAVRNDLPGIYNGAADGVLALSEVIGLLGKPMAPILPPWGTGLVAEPLNRLGLRLPVEMLNQLRYGRGLDNRKLKATGYRYRYTTRETVINFAEQLRMRPLLRSAGQPYQYEREVEEFLRWSPSVRRSGTDAGKAWRPSPRQVAELQRVLAQLTPEGGGAEPSAGDRRDGEPDSPVAEYDDLEAGELVALLPSLGRGDLEALYQHEFAGRRRRPVLEEIDRLLVPTRTAERG